MKYYKNAFMRENINFLQELDCAPLPFFLCASGKQISALLAQCRLFIKRLDKKEVYLGFLIYGRFGFLTIHLLFTNKTLYPELSHFQNNKQVKAVL